jgi:hypothetical protein
VAGSIDAIAVTQLLLSLLCGLGTTELLLFALVLAVLTPVAISRPYARRE